MKRLSLVLALVLLTTVLPAYAQHDHHNEEKEAQKDKQTAATADQQMAHHHVDMGPHMKLTPLRPATKEDKKRANDVVVKTRAAIERYTDVAVAERDGYKLFLPNVKHQRMYHYTNYRYAAEAAFRFNPEHPTSLLYQDDGKGGKKLIGAMFTAPKRATPEDLEARVPLSMAQWHAHVNLCVPPKGEREQMMRDATAGKKVKFGLTGSIATKEACESAGGTFMPQIFGWMVHLYPWESDPRQVWSLEKQMVHEH
jgi:hypothetical protein